MHLFRGPQTLGAPSKGAAAISMVPNRPLSPGQQTYLPVPAIWFVPALPQYAAALDIHPLHSSPLRSLVGAQLGPSGWETAAICLAFKPCSVKPWRRTQSAFIEACTCLQRSKGTFCLTNFSRQNVVHLQGLSFVQVPFKPSWALRSLHFNLMMFGLQGWADVCACDWMGDCQEGQD